MVGVGTALQHEGVDQPAMKADTDANAGLRVVGLLGGNQVVELTVQVRHRQHGQHPGDGFVLGGTRRGRTHRLPSVTLDPLGSPPLVSAAALGWVEA